MPTPIPSHRPTEEEVRRLLLAETERVLLNLRLWNLYTAFILSGGKP